MPRTKKADASRQPYAGKDPSEIDGVATRGGARPGAGRPPGGKGGYLVFYAKCDLYDKFMAEAELQNKTAPGLLREVITEWLERSREED